MVKLTPLNLQISTVNVIHLMDIAQEVATATKLFYNAYP